MASHVDKFVLDSVLCPLTRPSQRPEVSGIEREMVGVMEKWDANMKKKDKESMRDSNVPPPNRCSIMRKLGPLSQHEKRSRCMVLLVDSCAPYSSDLNVSSDPTRELTVRNLFCSRLLG